MAYHSFEKLEVWRESARLAEQTIGALSATRNYAFKDQMTRSSLSISSNIAEGQGRKTAKDFCRFLHIANGSTCELRSQLYLARRLKIVEDRQAKDLIEKTKLISSMLHRLSKSIEQAS